jgi:hypothetical protein
MMAGRGRTKSQRRRDNERRRKAADRLIEEIMGPMPEHIKRFASIGGNLKDPTPIDQLEAWQRAPLHVVEYDECPDLDRAVLARMSESASESRTQERLLQARELKAKYRHLWGKRGTPKIIASLETEEGNPLSERTVQRYFKLTKK